MSTTSVVEFDANGGSEVRDKIVQDSPTPIQLSQDSTYRDGYKFVGWNTERDGSGSAYEPNVSYTPALGQNVILYAQWQKLQEDLVIQVESNTDGFGSATVSWTDYNYVNRNFKVYQSADGGSTWNSVGVDYRDVKEVRCLQIYPVAAAKGQLKTWMETNSYGKDIIKIDEVLIDDFNVAPNSYLKDASGNYKYDVIFFGTYDSNGSKDLTASSLPYVEQFIKSGRGVIFGHDTMSAKRDYIRLLAPYINIDSMVSASGEYWTDGSVLYSPTIYSGNPVRPFGAPTQGTSAITPEVASTVKITSQGLLTNYSHNIGSNGTVLTIPAAHSGQAAHGRIWMRFYLDSYTQEQMNDPLNFYLTTNNNCAMIQTGHSNGLATDDEQKILANLIFYMNQLLFNTSTLRDASAQDTTAPVILSHEIKPDNQHAITLTSEDHGNTYSYYVESYTKDNTTETGRLHTSQTEDVTVTTGVKEYRYLFDDSPDTKISVTDINTLPTGMVDATIVYPIDKKYAHIVAIDGAGNVSDTYTVRLPATTRTTFEVKKVMKDGSSIADGEFSFYLKRAHDDGQPWATAPILERTTCNSDGLAYLTTPVPNGSVGIDSPGTYCYTIYEQKGTDAGMNYDDHYEAIRIMATDNLEGELNLELEYDISSDDDTEGIVFENTRLEVPVIVTKSAENVTDPFKQREYEFTIELHDANGNEIKNVPYHRYSRNNMLGKEEEIENGLMSHGGKFKLRAGEWCMIGTSNGTTYKVEETPLAGYTIESTATQGTLDITSALEASVTFTNIYEAHSTSPTYIGHVSNTGSRVEAGQYTFELVDKDGNVIGTAANTADGTFSFDGINFTAEDDGKTFDYVMRQVIPDDAENGYYIYDEEQARISVSVSDNGDGTLLFDVKATKGDSEYNIVAGEAIEFMNGFSIDMPETGLGGYWWIIGAGVGLLITSIAAAARTGYSARTSETRKRR